MKKLTRHIPNMLTMFNLLLGSVAVLFAFSGRYEQVVWLVALAAVFDFLDGTAARLLDARSAIGKELDSLADVVSFGLVPSAIMYSMLAGTSPFTRTAGSFLHVFALPAFLMVVCSALRLAKFNTDPQQVENFKGLPTPANALFVITLPFIYLQGAEGYGIAGLLAGGLSNYWVLLAITLLLSMLLVSNLPLLGLKIKSFSLQQNAPKLLLLMVAGLLILLLGVSASPFLLLAYFLISYLALRKTA